MKKIILVLVCLFVVLSLSGVNASEATAKVQASTPLAGDAIDKFLDKIFSQQKFLTRLKARVLSRSLGGISKKAKETWGYAYAQMPDMLLFIDRGSVAKNLPENQAAYILIDGTYLWDIKAGARAGEYEAERIDMKNAADRELNIAALLIGADVKNSKELREFYTLVGSVDDFGGTIGKCVHVNLKTIPGKEKKGKKEDIDIWFKAGQIIPWKISIKRLVKRVNPFSGKVSYKSTTSEKIIQDMQTNLSNPPLPPYPAEQFWLGRLLRLYPAMKVMEKTRVISPAELQKDLNSILSTLRDKQQKK